MNELADAFEDAAGKAGKGLAEDFADAYHGILKDTEEKTGQVADNVTKNEEEHTLSLDELRERVGGSANPVYRLKDDGTVERLTSDGPQALTQADRDRLGLGLDDDDKVPKRPTGRRSPYNLPEKIKGEDRPRTDSTQVPLGGSDLAEATQLARHEDGSYGNYTKDKGFQSNNYAAVRHGATDDPDGFVLVGRSDNPVHSERVLGIPMRQADRAGGLTELYTEREPCTTGPNCSAWMTHHLPSGITVTHSVEYGTDAVSQARGNKSMEDYLNSLWPGKPRTPR